MSNPFDYSNNICQSNESIWIEGVSEKEYTPWLINKALSYHFDTVMYAQEMNQRPGLDVDMQYDYLRLSIQPKKRRVSKWHKAEHDEVVKLISEANSMSVRHTEAYLSLLNTSQIDELVKKLDKGGRNGK